MTTATATEITNLFFLHLLFPPLPPRTPCQTCIYLYIIIYTPIPRKSGASRRKRFMFGGVHFEIIKQTRWEITRGAGEASKKKIYINKCIRFSTLSHGFAIPPPPPPHAVYTADSVLAISLRAESLSIYIYYIYIQVQDIKKHYQQYLHTFIYTLLQYIQYSRHTYTQCLYAYIILLYKIYCTRLACVRAARLTNHPSWISVSVAAVVL